MTEFTTRDGTQIVYQEWGAGQPIVFSHGSSAFSIPTGHAWTVHPIGPR
jgi:pimeloyl-ACP methyl ester carboxylesterase